MTDAEKIAEARARYHKALHAMQSGVNAEMQLGIAKDTTPKHLRVGVNSAMIESAALALLLIEKGVITELEYFRALAKAAEREQASYEKSLSAATGKRITLA